MKEKGSAIRRIVLLTALLLGSLLSPVYAETEVVARQDTVTKTPFVLVLSGGGSRGLAHIGLLRVLEWNGIVPDMIVGTSFGAVVGALWSSGYSTDEISTIFKDFDWSNLFSDRPNRTAMFLSKREYDQLGLLTLRFGPGGRPIVPSSLIIGQVLFSNLRHIFDAAPYQPTPSFDALRVPIRIVSCDLSNGERKVFCERALALACRATVSYPLFFAPVPEGTHLYADGGIAENIPVMTARELYPRAFVVAVNCTAPILPEIKSETPWEIADRVTTILQQDRNYLSQVNADIVLNPVTQSFSSVDFSKIDSLIMMGESSGLELLRKHPELQLRKSSRKTDEISIYAIPLTTDDRKELEQPTDNDYSVFRRLSTYYGKNGWVNGYVSKIDRLSDRTYYTVQTPNLISVRVEGSDKSLPTLMKGEIGLRTGLPLRKRDLDRTVDYLYGSGMFDFVYPVREAVPGGYSLRFLVKERTLPVLRLGAGYDSHRGGSGQIQFLYDNIVGISTHGALMFQFGERDVMASVRFRADRLVGKFGAVDFDVTGQRTEWPKFTEANLSQISYRRIGGSAALGQSVARWSLVAFGFRWQELQVDEFNRKTIYRLTPLFARLTMDTEDRNPFPNSGQQTYAIWESAQKQWSDAEYSRFYLYHVSSYKLMKRLVVSPQLVGGFNNGGSPRSEWYRIGGPWDFWGLETGEREARNLGMAAFTARWDLISQLVADTYLELRGNAAILSHTQSLRWKKENRILGGGIGVALSTWLGPVRLVWAWSGQEPEKATPMVSLSLGSSIPNPLGPRPIY
ncbi:MAG: patatin-like phospholipase family protein [bacterium]|nr:patatin-like phospholipase family protein [bacterium]